MKFEKISDKKFTAFEKSEVINPIMITGGKVDTSNPQAQTHDDYTDTQGRYDDYRESRNGTSIGSDTTTS